MKKITFYIGANNVDKMVDKKKVIEVLSDVENGWPSFTLIPTIGVFEGVREESIMAVIWTETHNTWRSLRHVASRLCRVLEQQCVGVEFDGDFLLVNTMWPSKPIKQKAVETLKPHANHVAVIECVENRIIDGKLRWWLHCRMRDGSYHLFNDVSDSTYNQLCKEEAEYELLCLGAEVERES